MEESLTLNVSQPAATAMMMGMALATPCMASKAYAQPFSSGANLAYVSHFATLENELSSMELYAQAIQRLTVVGSQNHYPADPLSCNQALLELIRNTFAPTGQQLADALGVTRTTIYNWLDEKTEVRPKNQDRLDALAGLAQSWNKSKSPRPKLRPAERRELFALLASQRSHCFEKAESLLKQIENKPTRTRPKSIREIQSEKNMEPLPEEVFTRLASSRIRSISEVNSEKD